MDLRITRADALLVSVTVFSLLVASVAFAGPPGDAGGPRATASAATQLKKLKKLKKQVALLRRQVQGISPPQGPQGLTGAQGPPGPATGPANGDLNGTYPNPLIDALGITTAKLDDGAVTSAKLDVFSVTGTKIQPNAVISSKLAAKAVDAGALGDIHDEGEIFSTQNGATEATSTCQAGERVISGGFTGEPGVDLRMSFRSGNGWFVRVTASGVTTGVAHAYCLES